MAGRGGDCARRARWLVGRDGRGISGARGVLRCRAYSSALLLRWSCSDLDLALVVLILLLLLAMRWSLRWWWSLWCCGGGRRLRPGGGACLGTVDRGIPWLG